MSCPSSRACWPTRRWASEAGDRRTADAAVDLAGPGHQHRLRPSPERPSRSGGCSARAWFRSLLAALAPHDPSPECCGLSRSRPRPAGLRRERQTALKPAGRYPPGKRGELRLRPLGRTGGGLLQRQDRPRSAAAGGQLHRWRGGPQRRPPAAGARKAARAGGADRLRPAGPRWQAAGRTAAAAALEPPPADGHGAAALADPGAIPAAGPAGRGAAGAGPGLSERRQRG